MTELATTLSGAIRTIPDFPTRGIQFKDITPVLADPSLLRLCVDALAKPFEEAVVSKVLGIEARGFILGGLLAERLNAGFIPVRKKGKLPYDTFSVEYDLEYGTDAVEMHVDALEPGDRVLIHDDVLATGGTAAAVYSLARRDGIDILGFSFLLELEFLKGRELLQTGIPIQTVLRF